MARLAQVSPVGLPHDPSMTMPFIEKAEQLLNRNLKKKKPGQKFN